MESADLNLETVTLADCAVVRVAGEIDLYTAPRLREQFNLLGVRGVGHVIADLRAVSFIDSTGLGVLVGALKRFREDGGTLSLVADGGRIRRLLEITSLARVLPPYHAVPDAMAEDAAWVTALGGQDAVTWCDSHRLG